MDTGVNGVHVQHQMTTYWIDIGLAKYRQIKVILAAGKWSVALQFRSRTGRLEMSADEIFVTQSTMIDSDSIDTDSGI